MLKNEWDTNPGKCTKCIQATEHPNYCAINYLKDWYLNDMTDFWLVIYKNVPEREFEGPAKKVHYWMDKYFLNELDNDIMERSLKTCEFKRKLDGSEDSRIHYFKKKFTLCNWLWKTQATASR